MLHDVAVHILGATAFEVIKAVAIGVLLIQLRRINWNRSTSLILIGLCSVVSLITLSLSAISMYRKSGFINGALFATNCFLFLSLLIAVIYLLVRRYFPLGIKRMDWSNANLWGIRASPIGRPAIASSPSKLLQFRAQFDGNGNKWAHMERWFSEVQDFSDWSGIRMRIKSDDLYPNSYIELQFMMSDDTTYTSEKVQIINQTVCFMFQQTSQAPWTPNQAVTFLDLHDIKCLIVACNTVCDDVNFSVGDFALIKSQICDREN